MEQAAKQIDSVSETLWPGFDVMLGRLKEKQNETSSDTRMRKMQKALAEFSKQPSEYWDGLGYCGDAAFE